MRLPQHLSIAFLFLCVPLVSAQQVPGTKPLTMEGDLAAQMVAGIDKYLMRELADSPKKRQQYWKPDFSSPEAYAKSVEPNRERLRKILGVVDKRVPVELEYVTTSTTKSLVADGKEYAVHQVRWSVLDGVDAEGLLLEPKRTPIACVVAIPDADWTPEMLVGLAKGVPEESQFARRLAENGCRVLVPTLIDRKDTFSGDPRIRYTNQPHREFIYRQAFEMGRHIIGYEIQKVLAAVDWFTKEKQHPPVGVIGYGEGGMLALYSGALDTRIKSCVVDGYFGPREEVWNEPIYRNVWAMLREFGDGELFMLITPRAITVMMEHQVPAIEGPPKPHDGRSGAAPGHLKTPKPEQVQREWDRGSELCGTIRPGNGLGRDLHLHRLATEKGAPSDGKRPEDLRKDFNPDLRQKRQFDQLCAFTQKLLHESALKRQEYWSKAPMRDPKTLAPTSGDQWLKLCEPYRKHLDEEVIGKLPKPTEPANPRSRLLYDTPKYKAYEVVLDLYPDVFAYGILCLPKDLKEGEKRPVVVCQHGLEGRPQDVVNPEKKTPYYNSFGSQLAERGYIVYAPQNPYIGKDLFRVLQRKANPLKLSLFSFIVRQHERTLDWLAELPFVDGERIGFYGLSYGGKTAMRVPALVPRYALSICSGDFNEWIWKNVNLDWRGSYMFTGEYEMFEFDLGHTFNYAEMAYLIAPRPFMVERGHDDGVGLDEYVAFEFAKVRRCYAYLGIPDKTTIEFFSGGHVINGKGTFEFLDKHLKWQAR